MIGEIIEVALPKLGESIVGATVVCWLKKEGDLVEKDEPLLEVSTDKVNSEIPSPSSGVIEKILVSVDQEIEIGTPLVTINIRKERKISHSHEEDSPSLQSLEKAPTILEQTDLSVNRESCKKSGLGKEGVFTPAVLRLAHIEGLSTDALRGIGGSGEGGRITKKDVEKFLCSRQQKQSYLDLGGNEKGFEERIQMSGMRKAIAENMVRSFYEAPHASLVLEVDVTEVMQLIAREKERFKQTHGIKLTITSFIIQALTKAVQQFPMLNASLEKETIVMKRYVNIGIAVNIDKGLVVPVIKNSEERSLVSLAKSVSELSQKARNGKLAPDEVADGTITLTNFGMTGALIGVPIIRYPEVAIIGAGHIQKRVVVREDDSLAVRQMMYLTLTFDHRVIDGIYGCQFLSVLKGHLESVSIH